VSTDTSQQQRLSSSTPMDTTPSISLQSVPNLNTPQQQVILVAVNQESNNNLPPLTINIPISSSSSSTTGSSLSAGSSTGQIKSQHESPIANSHSFLG
jgi:hypothetical protein